MIERHSRGSGAKLPRIDVVVAVFNEDRTMPGKIANLEALDYPADRLRFLVVDGGSNDGTAAQLARWAARDARVDLLQHGAADKAAQMNVALARCRAEWVLVTDADARLPPDTLRAMLRETRTRPGVDVVGTLASTPGHPLEQVHWQVSNWIRRREWSLGTTGLVIATCYLFRRRLVQRIPDGCAADDVHVACKAAASGKRVGLAEVTVLEIRAPATAWGVLRHKMRRTRGYLREVLRFLPSVARMAGPMRLVFAWRALALIGVPLAALAALGWITSAALGGQVPAAVLGASAALLAALAAGIWALGRYRPGHKSLLVVYPAVTLAILSLALLSYPFARKTGSLERVEPS